MKNIPIKTYLKLVLFLCFAVIAIFFPANSIDRIISDILQIKILAPVAKIISGVFNDKILLVLMVLLSIFLVYIKEWKKATFIFFTAGVGGVLLTFIKYTVRRPRPLPDMFSGYSFPSGHSLFVILFFLALLFVINKKNIVKMVAIFAIIAVPISRVVLGAHFLSDVVAALLLGSVIIDLMKVYYIDIYNIIMKFVGKKNEKK